MHTRWIDAVNAGDLAHLLTLMAECLAWIEKHDVGAGNFKISVCAHCIDTHPLRHLTLSECHLTAR